MKRNHGAEVAGLAAVVRAALASPPSPVASPGPAALAALALVEQWLRGEDVTAADLETARAAAHAEGEQASRACSAIKGGPEWQTRGAEAIALQRRSWGASAAGNLCWVTLEQKGWESSSTFDAATYAAPEAPLADVRARAVAAASAAVRALEPPPAGEKPRRLAAADLAHLGPVVAAALVRRKASVEPKLRADAKTLRACLVEHGYRAHASVLAFEARDGGLLVPDEDDEWLFGAFACLTSWAHADPRGGRKDLVPVASSPNDVVYFLDAKGTAWAQDTIADAKATPFARGGERLVARIVLYDLALRGKSVAFEGARGEELAEALGLEAIPEASDDLGRFWGDGKRLVIEDGSPVATRVVGVARSKLARFGP